MEDICVATIFHETIYLPEYPNCPIIAHGVKYTPCTNNETYIFIQDVTYPNLLDPLCSALYNFLFPAPNQYSFIAAITIRTRLYEAISRKIFVDATQNIKNNFICPTMSYTITYFRPSCGYECLTEWEYNLETGTATAKFEEYSCNATACCEIKMNYCWREMPPGSGAYTIEHNKSIIPPSQPTLCELMSIPINCPQLFGFGGVEITPFIEPFCNAICE